MIKQKGYTIRAGYKKYFDLLEFPPKKIRSYIKEKTLSKKINEAVRIATSDFLELKNENLKLRIENNILKEKIKKIKDNKLKINELNNENQNLLKSNY